MQDLKKYFTEGLIQMAIILSLCGVMVDVGLEPYLPASWHERILGPTSALTQTQFHNLRNRLEDGPGLHAKNVDLDSFFTARRLLGLVHSLDRLQVPPAELETWLVQREQDPLPVGLPGQASRLAREPPGIERVQLTSSLESRPLVLTLHEDADDEEEDKEEETDVHYHTVALNEGEEEEDTVLQHYCNIGREGGPGSSGGVNNGELPQNEQVSSSLQECLRLLEETFPLTEEQQFHDAGGGRGELELQSPGSEPLGSSILPSTNPFLDLELQWQDLLAIMEPQNNAGCDTSAFEDAQNSRATETFETLHQNHGVDGTEADLVMETWSQPGSLRPPNQSEMEPVLLPLTPTEELDDHSSASSSGVSGVYPLQSPPDHMDLLAQDPSPDLCLGRSAEDVMNRQTQDLVATPESSSSPENCSGDCTNIQEGNAATRGLYMSPSGDFLFDEDGIEDDDGLLSPLTDLIGDAAILDEISLLDMALEEGFNPEMTARLDEEGYLLREAAQQETARAHLQPHLGEDQVHPGDYQQDSETEADSDSGLSLAFSLSQASPCASEASSYSSSSSTSSSDSADESLFSEDEDAVELCDGPHMEMEVTIKQEEEEELGAVGGSYPDHAMQTFHQSDQEKKLLSGLPWHLGHDHTYHQPMSSSSSPSLPVGKMSTKQSRSSVRRNSALPYHYSSHTSDAKMWSHDERRARALKVPFSNELIINLPVEEFNDLLASFQLNEEQLTLIKDIRRRGKNKVAAQNCRKRKMDVLLGLNDEVSGLMRSRSRLLREKQEAMRNLQEMKHRLKMLYQEVFSRVRDGEGRPLNPVEHELRFELDGSVGVASSRRGRRTPLTKSNRKQRDKKK
ncbi:endoplasmic reticulum membrane sensor NFE2L1a isoform X1 [Takifugu rubripes]|uniref:Endoplasmic reticulum membrane sensor NFE2L1 n=1 Tax=Takifugu rubripes TaxID=31033 RepID=A0A674MIB5_TAKRU|nr:endoplasmic reticulum membrane sensor NFE2L1-like isoform X1 [Takifugu rubripes]